MIQTNIGTKKSIYSGTLKKDVVRGTVCSGFPAHAMQEARSSTSESTINAASPHIFRLTHAPYLHTTLRAALLLSVLLASAVFAALLAAWLWPTYSHSFAPYLKWQDALLASACYLVLLSLLGCAMVLRFFIALHSGHCHGMLTILDTNAASSSITVRDLSDKNLSSITRVIRTAYACFLATLTGLLPAILIGWTTHLPDLALAVLATTAAIALLIAGLVITLPSFSFIIIGWIGSISFTRKLGAPQTYKLTNSTILIINQLELIIVYPDAPEAVIDLNLLDPRDQRHLLHLLRKRWLDAQCPWNPHLGEEIEIALKEAQHFTMLV